jgi:hypothetical protein
MRRAMRKAMRLSKVPTTAKYFEFAAGNAASSSNTVATQTKGKECKFRAGRMNFQRTKCPLVVGHEFAQVS